MTDRAPGWILVHRSMTDALDRVWNHPSPFDVRSARLDLLVQARFTAGPFATSHGVELLQRGEFVGSLRYFATRWKWTKSRVERYLSRCVADGFISRQRPGRHGDVYLVVNYDRYQDAHAESGRQPRRERDAIGTKDKEGKEGKSLVTSIGDDARLIGFARCWAIYPRRKGGNSKQSAEAAYLARVRAGVDEQHLYVRTLAYKSACEAVGKIGTEYVLMAKTFYGKDRRYDDDFGSADGNSSDEGATPMPGARDAEDARKLRLAGF